MRYCPIRILTLALSALTATSAVAQTEEVAPPEIRELALSKTSTTKPDGWTVTAKLGGSFNVTDARDVVGAQEGTAIQIGVNLSAEAKYKAGQNTWDTVLTIQEALQRTPPPDEDTPAPFVKSLDNLDLLSTYVYRLSSPDWLGPFVQFKLNTQIFETTTEPTTDYALQRTFKDGTQSPPELRDAGQSFDQTAPFEPLLLREVAGLFGEPIAEDVFTFSFKAGVGAQQTIARDGFTLISSDGTDDASGRPLYVLQQIQNTNDIGVEGTVNLKGTLIKDVLTWKAGVVAFLPFVASGDVVKVDDAGDPVLDDNGNPEFLSTTDRLNLEITGGLSLKLTDYLSFDYSLLVRRFPQVRDAFQIQNNFLLTVTIGII